MRWAPSWAARRWPRPRSAAAAPAASSTTGSDPEKKEEDPAASAAEGDGEDSVEDGEEEDTVQALQGAFPKATAAIRAQAASAERARVAGIRALGRPGVEPLITACSNTLATR